LHALALGAATRWAGDRFDAALAEARAHRGTHGTVPGSAHAAARWLVEAVDQLHTVQRGVRNLQRHNGQNPSLIASMAADTVAALCDRLENDYRHRNRQPTHATGYSLKDSMTMGLETVITSRGVVGVAAAPGRPGPAAHTARAWIGHCHVD
jgi:hypothetical protein